MKKIIDKLKEIDKKHYLIIGIICLIIFVIFCIVFFGKNYRMFLASYDGGMFINEYESLNNKLSEDEKKYPKVNISFSSVKYITIEEALAMLEKGSGLDGTGVIYIGYAECIYCRSAIQVLTDTAKESEIDKIYYLDINKYWDIKEVNSDGEVVVKQKAHDKYNDLLTRLNNDDLYYTTDYILNDKDGNEVYLNERRVASPLVLFVVDGYIISSNAGTIVSQVDPYEPLNEEQIKSLSTIYKYGIRDVVNGINDYKKLESNTNKKQ